MGTLRPGRDALLWSRLPHAALRHL